MNVEINYGVTKIKPEIQKETLYILESIKDFEKFIDDNYECGELKQIRRLRK